jgi:Xaa-Pro dipeptidase
MIKIRERLDRVYSKIEHKELQGLLLLDEESITYLSGARVGSDRPSAAIFPSDGEPCLITSKLIKNYVPQRTWVEDVKIYEDIEPYHTRLTEFLKDAIIERRLTNSKIGIELEALSIPTFGALREKLPKVQFVDVSGLVGSVRMIKEHEEINLIKTACKIADSGLEAEIKSTDKGISEIEIEGRGLLRMAEEACKISQQIEYSAYSIVVSGPKTYLLSYSGNRTIQQNSVVGLNTFASCNGYWSEVERTMFVGLPLDAHKRVFEVMLKAQDEAINVIRPGIKASEIDKKAREVIAQEGYEEFLLHRTGHGIGLSGTESPIISRASDTLLEQNMVLCVEPGIYDPEVGGFRNSDTVLVTKDDHELLTKCDRNLV